jgi:LacI family transcriptional regulator
MLTQSGTPTVVISVYRDDLPYDHVRTDDRRAGYVIARHLLDLGHRRIAVVTDIYGPSYERLQGTYDALQEAEISEETPCIFLAPDTYEGGFAAGQKILESGEPLPEAIFATTDMMTLGLLEALRSHGIRIPEDIAIASHDGLHASAFVTPPLTTVAPRARDMGKTSVDRLLQSYVEQQPPSVHMVEADLLVRASTIGTEQMQTFSTPISDPIAWSRWRTQTVPIQRKRAEVARLTFGQVLHNRKEAEALVEI